jgi:pyrophosphatase PpaX
MPYKAVIFDLDGTLVHTAPEYRYKVIGETLKELGVFNFLPEHADMLWFETKRNEIIRRYFYRDPEMFWKIYSEKENAESRRQHIRLYDDIDFVTYVKSRGCKIGLVTGSPEHITDLEVGAIGREKFDSVVVARYSTGIKAKPHPEGLEKCLDFLCVERHEAIFVGNAEEDILAAKSAGIMDVYLQRGEYEFDLKKMNPSLSVSSLYELKSLPAFR